MSSRISLGHEAAGVVEKVGDDVDNVAPGDFRDYCLAGTLQYAVGRV